MLREETSWSARPELAPDGRRLLYSSYHGRQWHQLWLTTPSGAPPLPLTFGEFDLRNARWSPDGARIVYIANENGNTELLVLDTIGGERTPVVAKRRKHRLPQAHLTIEIRDGQGRMVPARVTVRAADGRAHAPESAWMHADDGFDRARQRVETQYFHCATPCALDVPAGQVTISVQHGFAHLPWASNVELAAGESRKVMAELKSNALPAAFGSWMSADLHVHTNYGGHYRNSMQNVLRQAAAEDLDVDLQPDRQQGRTHPGHRPVPARGRSRQRRRAPPDTGAGVPHELLGSPGPAQPVGSPAAAGFLELSAYGVLRARIPTTA